jgi:hypothetical protein
VFVKVPCKRAIVIAATVLCLAAPAHAVGPLAAIFIAYAKQMIKEKMIAYAKGKAMGLISDGMGEMPGMGMLSTIVPGVVGGAAARPSLPNEARDALQAAGLFDTNAQPLSDEEWAELEQTQKAMASAAGPDAKAPDLASMREMLKQSPQLAGVARALFGQFHAIRTEQQRMKELYDQMPENERQEVADELVKSFRESPVEDQPQMRRVLQSDALGWPDDLRQRILAALPQLQ